MNPSFRVHVISFLLEDSRSIMASRKPYNYYLNTLGAVKRKSRNAREAAAERKELQLKDTWKPLDIENKTWDSGSVIETESPLETCSMENVEKQISSNLRHMQDETENT